MKRYRVAKGNTIGYGPEQFIKEGDIVPSGAMSASEVARCVGLGVLEDVDASPAPVAAPPRAPAAAPPQRETIWDFDPATLKGRSLEQLNIMAQERDPNAKPFDDPKEAIAFMSQGFKAKKAGAKATQQNPPIEDEESVQIAGAKG